MWLKVMVFPQDKFDRPVFSLTQERFPPIISRSIAASAAHGQVAQLVEQRIENPRVDGSIPPLATSIQAALSDGSRYGFWSFLCGLGAVQVLPDNCVG